MFYSNFIQLPRIDWVDADLLDRDLIRSSTFRVSGYGAEDFTNVYDVEYQSRDRGQSSGRAQRSFITARALDNRAPTLTQETLSNLNGFLWAKMTAEGQIPGNTRLSKAELPYGARLLSYPVMYIAHRWCAAHHFLTKHDGGDRFRLMMWLSTIAFSEQADMSLIGVLIAFYCMPNAFANAPPSRATFKFFEGASPKDLICMLEMRSFAESSEARLQPLLGESATSTEARRRQVHESHQLKMRDRFVAQLTTQWPCRQPTPPSAENFSKYINVTRSMTEITGQWEHWWWNLQFREWLGRVENELKLHSYQTIDSSFSVTRREPPVFPAERHRRFVGHEDLFNQPAPEVMADRIDNLASLIRNLPIPPDSNDGLLSLVHTLETRICADHEKEYLTTLRESVSKLERAARDQGLTITHLGSLLGLLENHLQIASQQILDVQAAMEPVLHSYEISYQISHAPRISTRFLLQQLSRTRWSLLSADWKQYIVTHARSIRSWQRAERLVQASGNAADLVNELTNVGDEGWDPVSFPEWLLLEVESGLIMRKVQTSIAKHMLHPKSGHNAVMQLNMGEGKSTFIVPAVAAALANGDNLVRIVVARPQSKQMFEMLVSKLGGFLDRRIYHMPISRSLRLGQADAENLRKMCLECQSNGGILLVQPEHLLSFQLMSIESGLTDDASLSQTLADTLHYFDKQSRDVVDESDENFSVKFELVYTMGAQQAIDLSPDRWTIVQHVLSLATRFAPQTAEDTRVKTGVDCVEIHDLPGRVPIVRLLRPEAGLDLRTRIAEHICNFGMPGFPVAHMKATTRTAVLTYLTQPTLNEEQIRLVEDNNSSVWTESNKGPLLLLRGLLAGGVFEFCLGNKRWKVNYGLDGNRLPPTKLAVPYRAKDCPSARSEFSHPDVVILLTCLSYYYGGLSNQELLNSFQLLLKADQADVEYSLWTETAHALPTGFQHLSSINLQDRRQCVEELFPALRFSKGAIDYYLAQLVFPKGMREFPHKISASGWDLGKKKARPTTGFSGTADSRHLLPLDVHHLDLDQQKHTSALVLKHILQEENSTRLWLPRNSVDDNDNRITDAEDLLNNVVAMDPACRVILDVGAQVLELTNVEVASKWLSMCEGIPNIEAAIFFDDADQLSVIDKAGDVDLLQVSPYASRLDACLVFLDEAHTRGTDLKMPGDWRAAVTLGARLTKDRLVQACMRMRKLGKGQSVVFFIPPEIQGKIKELKGACDESPISVSDVLAWSISETYVDHRRSIPLWAMQGKRFQQQAKLWDNARPANGLELTSELATRFLEKEARSLEERYRPRSAQHAQLDQDDAEGDANTLIRKRCLAYSINDYTSAALEEEQERELSPEVEEERQVEKPAPMEALKHSLHPDLTILATTGRLAVKSDAFLPAFESLRSSSASQYLDAAEFPKDLLVTADFARTVKPVGLKYCSDAYLRPVQWIITCANQGNKKVRMVFVSPFEANALLPDINRHAKVSLHLYLPRQARQFQPLDSLDLFTQGKSFNPGSIPSRLTIQLNLFAGQLYMDTYEEYTAVCDFLGLAWSPQEDGVVVGLDGFIADNWANKFKNSPVRFLQTLMTKIRRNCDGIEKTHMGQMLSGILLEETGFTE